MILDYRKAHFYVASSAINHLFIQVDGRTRTGGLEYLALAPHPRETTFMDDGDIFGPVLASEKGASFITFLIDQPANRAVVSRRCDYSPGQPENFKLQVGASPYSGSLTNPPQEVTGDMLPDTMSLFAAIADGRRLVAVVEYVLQGVTNRIEFPVRGVNINPNEAAGDGRQWQVISPEVGVVIESRDPAQRLRPGYVAFGRVGPSVSVSLLYIADVASPRSSQDFSHTVTQTASVELFALPD